MSSFEPRISIVVTCYNYGRYVGQAIESALAQTYRHVEVVVVDDGSIDDSAVVIQRHSERIRSVRQSNQGSIAAYNRGYMESTGDLVLFLDADDVLDSTVAEEVAGAWYPGCVKVQFDLRIIDASGDDLGRRFCNFVAGYDVAAVRHSFARTGTYRWPVTVGNAYSRHYLEAMVPLKVGLGPDGLLNTVAPVYGDVVTIPRCLASYRLHGSNMWSTNGLDLERLPERIFSRRLEIAELVAHSRSRGVDLPPGDLLDHELAFINYRLMSRRLGQRYEGCDAETVSGLWWLGLSFIAAELMPLRAKIAHGVWLSVMWVSPRRVAAWLIGLRYRRAQYTQPIRRTLRRMWRREVVGSSVRSA